MSLEALVHLRVNCLMLRLISDAIILLLSDSIECSIKADIISMLLNAAVLKGALQGVMRLLFS